MQIPYVAVCLIVVAATSAVALPTAVQRLSRDVSHLEYLPPLPSRDYLPPLIDVPQKLEEQPVTPISNEYLPPPPELKVSNEYLPPAPNAEPTETNDDVNTEEPTTTTEAAELETTTATEVQDSAVLLDDGYHYKTPEVQPDLFKVAEEQQVQKVDVEAETMATEHEELGEQLELEQQGEYLPPLEEGVVVAEGPANDESSVLADDGYHYRAIRRLRF